jgi:hypothetical protein
MGIADFISVKVWHVPHFLCGIFGKVWRKAKKHKSPPPENGKKPLRELRSGRFVDNSFSV